MSEHHMRACGFLRGQESASDLLGQESQMIVSYHVERGWELNAHHLEEKANAPKL